MKDNLCYQWVDDSASAYHDRGQVLKIYWTIQHMQSVHLDYLGMQILLELEPPGNLYIGQFYKNKTELSVMDINCIVFLNFYFQIICDQLALTGGNQVYFHCRYVDCIVKFESVSVQYSHRIYSEFILKKVCFFQPFPTHIPRGFIFYFFMIYPDRICWSNLSEYL